MAITRTPMVDDDGSGTTGTIINNAWKTEFYNQIDAAIGAATPSGAYAIVGQSAAQSLVPADWRTMVFDTEMADTATFWTPGQPTRLTVPAGLGGLYLVVANFAMAATTQSIPWNSSLMLNAGTYLGFGTHPFLAGASSGGLIATITPLSPGYFVESLVVHSHSVAVSTYQVATKLAIVRLAL